MKKLISIILILILSVQATLANWFSQPSISNWISFDFRNSYSLEVTVEVLEEPLTFRYIPDKNNLKVVNYLKKKGFKAENYNYLWLKKNEAIKYPFLITQKYIIGNPPYYINDNSNQISTLKYFPLIENRDYPDIYDKTIFIGETYGVKYPKLKLNWKIVPSYKKFKLNKRFFDWFRWEPVGTKISLQNEWNWDIDIPLYETFEVEFSYYATSINRYNYWGEKNESHYAYYHAGLDIRRLESFYGLLIHKLKLPEGYTAEVPYLNTNYKKRVFMWPYIGNIYIPKGNYIEILESK